MHVETKTTVEICNQCHTLLSSIPGKYIEIPVMRIYDSATGNLLEEKTDLHFCQLCIYDADWLVE